MDRSTHVSRRSFVRGAGLAGAAALGAPQFTLQPANHIDHFVTEQILEVVHRHAGIFEHALPVVAHPRRVEWGHVKDVGLGAFFREEALN
jgi:hypothetical protein